MQPARRFSKSGFPFFAKARPAVFGYARGQRTSPGDQEPWSHIRILISTG